MGNMASLKVSDLNLRRVVLLLTTMGIALLLASGVAHAAPANDFFLGAQQITSTNTMLSGTNLFATREWGEPNHAGSNGASSVWYYWTAQENGYAAIDTLHTTFTPAIGVYTGSAVNALTEVAHGNYPDEASFTATAGTTYRIAIDTSSSYNAGPLSVGVDTELPPANDFFAHAQQITGANAEVTGYNRDSSKQWGEPDHAGVYSTLSVWYYWTPQRSGTATIDTFGSKDTFGRDLDTLLGVYTGSAVNALTEVASNDDAGGGVHSQVSFPATEGTTYRIAVDSSRSYGGDIKLRLASDTAPPDTTAPDVPVITGQTNSSFDTDGTFTVSGTAEANSTVELFEGPTSMGTTVADASGGWSIEFTDVSEGSHFYTAKATDLAGNTSEESEARTVIVDTTAPQAPSITSPVEGGLNLGSFTISGSAEAGAKVELFEGEVSKGEAIAGSDGTWSIDLTGVTDGSHSYKAKASDEAGNVSAESEARTVRVDATAPLVRRVVPKENATGIGPGANVSAFFSEAMKATSVKSAFKLYKKGSTTPLDATVTYDAATKKAVLDPSASLQRGATYKVVVTTGARDLTGNALDQNPTQAGNQQKVWVFTISP